MSAGAALGLAVCALVACGCSAIAPEPSPEEHMPLFASIWLTLLPAEPQAPVAIRVTSPDLEGWSREHTFEPGVRVAGSIPLSSGSYRLTALDGACAIDLRIGGEREADVLLRLTDASDCELVQTGEHGQSAGTHREPAVLIAPDSVPATESP